MILLWLVFFWSTQTHPLHQKLIPLPPVFLDVLMLCSYLMGIWFNHFTSKILSVNSNYCLLYNSYEVSLENSLSGQLVIPFLYSHHWPAQFLLILWGEILSWLFMAVRGSRLPGTPVHFLEPLFCLSFRGELQEEHYNDLRSELFKHIFTFSPGPRIVLTRLCVAVSI